MTGLPGLDDGRLRDRRWLERRPLAQLLKTLNGGGEETRIVGGAVRDLVLGLPVREVDLATTALPEDVRRRAKACGFRTIPTGLSHGTVTVIAEGAAFETTTLREDIETDGRHAKVVFGRDFGADARRRDLTINALSLDRDGFVHDPVGGLADLAARRVRFIGDAGQRIREDYLRILRFFRFSARFGEGPLDAEGFGAAIRNREGLDRLSRERIRMEVFKLAVAPRAPEVVTAMADGGFFQPIFAGMAYPGRFRRLVASSRHRSQPDDAMLRMMALGVVTIEDADRLRERLRFANAEYRRASQAARAFERLHGIERAPSLQSLDALSVTCGREAVRDALRLAEAEAGAAPDDPDFVAAEIHLSETIEPAPPFSGKDVVARGVPPGPKVGRTLKTFQQAWLAAGMPNDSKTLNRLLDDAIGRNMAGRRDGHKD